MTTESARAVVVAAVRCDTYDDDRVLEAVQRGLQLLGGVGQFVRPGERIVLKPNLLAGRGPERAVTTHPSVFRAVVRTFADAGGDLQYGDSPGFGKTETIAGKAGLASVARDLRISVADFQHGETVSFPEGDLIKQFTVAKGVLDADGLISLPKMKTHGLTRMTGAIKNQFGCIPGTLKAEFHARLPNADLFSRMLVDLNRFLRPRLFVMDGIVAMEGNGPQAGSPRPMNVILLSEDPVAVDATTCRLMKLNPALVPPIVHGARQGLGISEGIHYVGDPIDSFVAEDFDVNRSARSTTGKAGRYSRLARRLVVPKPVIRAERCIRCGTCVEVCPVTPKAVMFEGSERSRPPVHHYDRCIRCYCCQEMCPESAISIHVPLLGRTIHRR